MACDLRTGNNSQRHFRGLTHIAIERQTDQSTSSAPLARSGITSFLTTLRTIRHFAEQLPMKADV